MSELVDITKPDTVHRGLLWHLKSNSSERTTDTAEAFLNSFKFSVFIDSDEANDPAHQICLLTIVNAASRIAIQPNSVQVFGITNQQRNDNSGLSGTLEDAVKEVGGACSETHHLKDTLGITIGNATSADCKFNIRAVFEGWRGGIIPNRDTNPFQSTNPIPLGAILAAGLAVYECFRFVNEEGSAIGQRKIGLSLWNLDENNWQHSSSDEPTAINCVQPLWFCGLGHLGQAYIWTLGHLPIKDELRRSDQITIQDKDIVSLSNLSTSLLSSPKNIDVSKVMICNNWLRERGFSEIIAVEHYLTHESKIDFGKSYLVCGFDSKKARRQAALRKPNLMIDGGIGGKPDDFQSISMTVLPSDIDPMKRWAGNEDDFSGAMPFALEMHYGDDDEAARCGLETLNGKAVGFPFVGVITAAIVMSELLRRYMDGNKYQSLSLDLRDVKGREILRKF